MYKYVLVQEVILRWIQTGSSFVEFLALRVQIVSNVAYLKENIGTGSDPEVEGLTTKFRHFTSICGRNMADFF